MEVLCRVCNTVQALDVTLWKSRTDLRSRWKYFSCNTKPCWLILADLNFQLPQVDCKSLWDVKSHTGSQGTKLQRTRNVPGQKKELPAVSLFPVCRSPNLDEADYLGTRHYTAEDHPTQSCRAADSKGWQKRQQFSGCCATEYHPFYLMVGLDKKQNSCPCICPPSFKMICRVTKSTPKLTLQVDC